MEVLGVVTGAGGALEQSIKLFQWVRNAIKVPEETLKILDAHSGEVERIKNLLDLVAAEKSLQTFAVSTAAQDVGEEAEALSFNLGVLKRKSEAKRSEQIIRALFKGSDNEGEIQRVMGRLLNAKVSLVSCVLVTNVGLIRGVDNSVQINTAKLDRMNALLQERLGRNQSLELSKVVEGRTATGGLVDLTVEDMEALSLSKHELSGAHVGAPARSSRPKKIIKNNLAVDDSWMQNVPISEVDIWKDFDVTIMNCRTEGSATMLNQPVPKDVLLEMIRARSGRGN